MTYAANDRPDPQRGLYCLACAQALCEGARNPMLRPGTQVRML